MSYDLMVFDPTVAPRDRDEFMRWYQAQTQWSEPHDYSDPARCSSQLAALYLDMRHEFPDMRSVDHDGLDEGNLKITDYSLGYSMLYLAFRWPVAESAYAATRAAAVRHGVGFFDASADDAEIWFPALAEGER